MGGQGGCHTKNLDRALPGAHTRQLYDRLKREDAKILVQMRTGRCGLNHYLHRTKRAESATCEACQTPETVRHFLVECRHANASGPFALTFAVALPRPIVWREICQGSNILLAILYQLLHSFQTLSHRCHLAYYGGDVGVRQLNVGKYRSEIDPSSLGVSGRLNR